MQYCADLNLQRLDKKYWQHYYITMVSSRAASIVDTNEDCYMSSAEMVVRGTVSLT